MRAGPIGDLEYVTYDWDAQRLLCRRCSVSAACPRPADGAITGAFADALAAFEDGHATCTLVTSPGAAA